MQEKEKRNKYYLFYLRDTLSLYAYTDQKDLSDIFQMHRDMRKFIFKKMKLTSDDLKELSEEVPDKLLILYNFGKNNYKVQIPITQCEKLNMEHYVNQALCVDLFLIAERINPEIFQKEMRKALKTLKWDEYYKEYHEVITKVDTGFAPDYLQCFLTLYASLFKNPI